MRRRAPAWRPPRRGAFRCDAVADPAADHPELAPSPGASKHGRFHTSWFSPDPSCTILPLALPSTEGSTGVAPAGARSGGPDKAPRSCARSRPALHPPPPPPHPPPRRVHARVQGRRESSDVWRRHLCRQAGLRRHAAPVFATGEPKARVSHLQGPRVAARGRCAQGARTGCRTSVEPGGRLAEARSARAAAGRISASERRSHSRLFLRGQLLAERKAAWSAGPGPSRGAARPPRARGRAKKRVLD